MKAHMKRYAAPVSWSILRKTTKFVTKPNPGPHCERDAMPLAIWLRKLGFAKTMREIKIVLRTQKVLVDGRRVKDAHFPIGLFDTLTIGAVSQEVGLDSKGRLVMVPANHALKPLRIMRKSSVKGGKIQLTLIDGRNICLDSSTHAVGDTVLVELPKQAIKGHVALAPGSKILLAKGANAGAIGTVDKIDKNRLWYKDGHGSTRETKTSYAYALP